MTPLSSTIDVDRPPADVFAYTTDATRFHEWQKGVVDGRTTAAASHVPALHLFAHS